MGTHRAIIAEDYTAFTAKKWVRWSQKMREGFLDHLAATCNVKASAAFIGVDPVSVYLLRRRDARFVEGWGEALALGYEMLETQLVGHALAGDEGAVLTNGADTRMGPISVALALKLLTLHRDATGKPRKGGAQPRFAEAEDTDRAILKKLAAIEARRRAEALEAPRDAIALPPPEDIA